MSPLELLYEAEGLPAFELPAGLAAMYGGTLGFEGARLYANFVATLDGVVSIPSLPSSNTLIAGGSESDRFVMGLLRACADALLVGSGTLTAAPGSLWTPAQAFPGAAAEFAELRVRLGRAAGPEIVVLTASGLVDPAHPALAAGAVVVTTDEGAAVLADRLPPAATLASLGPGPGLDPGATVRLLHERGHRVILSEGGPTTIAALVAAGLVDELFLTISPLLAGRPPLERRLGLVEGVDLVPGGLEEARLLGARRDGGHLFLRYELAGRGKH